MRCTRPGFDSWAGTITWRREWLLTPVFLPGEFHGLYSHWVAKSQTGLSDFNFQLNRRQEKEKKEEKIIVSDNTKDSGRY